MAQTILLNHLHQLFFYRLLPDDCFELHECKYNSEEIVHAKEQRKKRGCLKRAASFFIFFFYKWVYSQIDVDKFSERIMQ